MNIYILLAQIADSKVNCTMITQCLQIKVTKLYFQRNGTTWADGRLEMHTGEGDMGRLGRIETWQGRDRTDAFKGECGKVRGAIINHDRF